MCPNGLNCAGEHLITQIRYVSPSTIFLRIASTFYYSGSRCQKECRSSDLFVDIVTKIKYMEWARVVCVAFNCYEPPHWYFGIHDSYLWVRGNWWLMLDARLAVHGSRHCSFRAQKKAQAVDFGPDAKRSGPWPGEGSRAPLSLAACLAGCQTCQVEICRRSVFSLFLSDFFHRPSSSPLSSTKIPGSTSSIRQSYNWEPFPTGRGGQISSGVVANIQQSKIIVSMVAILLNRSNELAPNAGYLGFS